MILWTPHAVFDSISCSCTPGRERAGTRLGTVSVISAKGWLRRAAGAPDVLSESVVAQQHSPRLGVNHYAPAMLREHASNVPLGSCSVAVIVPVSPILMSAKLADTPLRTEWSLASLTFPLMMCRMIV